ncbi:MAG TPA: VOC family protein [Acidimicrobiales bacterium]|jgi:catechol 2,3-dioxygenase-like lactoylglutathione lyase family enzyme|nr:VOC family protein [Acidimicrobiales bacterium]
MPTTAGLRISSYSHVAIAVTDVAAAKGFYCDLLGFEELPRPDFGIPGMWLRVGDLQLHMIETSQMPVPGPGFPHLALYVPTEEFAATIETLRAAGVKVLGEPSSRVDFGRTVWAAFVTDPAGNVVELTDVGPLPAA